MGIRHQLFDNRFQQILADPHFGANVPLDLIVQFSELIKHGNEVGITAEPRGATPYFLIGEPAFVAQNSEKMLLFGRIKVRSYGKWLDVFFQIGPDFFLEIRLGDIAVGVAKPVRGTNHLHLSPLAAQIREQLSDRAEFAGLPARTVPDNQRWDDPVGGIAFGHFKLLELFEQIGQRFGNLRDIRREDRIRHVYHRIEVFGEHPPRKRAQDIGLAGVGLSAQQQRVGLVAVGVVGVVHRLEQSFENPLFHGSWQMVPDLRTVAVPSGKAADAAFQKVLKICRDVPWLDLRYVARVFDCKQLAELRNFESIAPRNGQHFARDLQMLALIVAPASHSGCIFAPQLVAIVRQFFSETLFYKIFGIRVCGLAQQKQGVLFVVFVENGG